MKFDYINPGTCGTRYDSHTDAARLELYPAIIKVRYRGTDVSAETVKESGDDPFQHTATRQQISLDAR